MYTWTQICMLLLNHFSRVWLCATSSLGFSRQEHWSGLPFPSPRHKSEKWKWSRTAMSDSSRPHGLQPTRLLRPWDFVYMYTYLEGSYAHHYITNAILRYIYLNVMYMCVYVYIYIYIYIYICTHSQSWASLVAQMVTNPPAMRKTWVRCLGWEDPLEESMATHSSILAWRIPKDEGTWQVTVHGLQTVGHDWTTNNTHTQNWDHRILHSFRLAFIT